MAHFDSLNYKLMYVLTYVIYLAIKHTCVFNSRDSLNIKLMYVLHRIVSLMLNRMYVSVSMSLCNIKTYVRFSFQETLWVKTHVCLSNVEPRRYKNIYTI